MNRILINFCAFCLIFFGIELYAQNNLTIIDSLIVESTNEILESGKEEIYDNVILQIGELNKNIDGYLITEIGNILKKRNYQVFRNFPKDSSFESIVIQVQNCIIKIDYSEPFSKSMLDETFVKRSILVSMIGQLYNNNDNRIISPIKLNNQFNDEIKYDEIELMEESPYSFTNGAKSGITLWQSILEPVLVVSSVLTVLLLLFTQRS